MELDHTCTKKMLSCYLLPLYAIVLDVSKGNILLCLVQQCLYRHGEGLISKPVLLNEGSSNCQPSVLGFAFSEADTSLLSVGHCSNCWGRLFSSTTRGCRVFFFGVAALKISRASLEICSFVRVAPHVIVECQQINLRKHLQKAVAQSLFEI